MQSEKSALKLLKIKKKAFFTEAYKLAWASYAIKGNLIEKVLFGRKEGKFVLVLKVLQVWKSFFLFSTFW